MSRGLVKNIGWDGLVKAIDRQAHEAWRLPDATCPWCGQDLGVSGPDNAPEEKTAEETMRTLSAKAWADGLPWFIAVLLVGNPSASDQTIASHLGMSKTKVNEARRRLSEVCPKLSSMAAKYDRTVSAQRRRRKAEGKARLVPPPLVGTLEGRVRNRFAQRAVLKMASSRQKNCRDLAQKDASVRTSHQ